ncbi:hypothetical protein HY620_03625 [Candidatus Uhrbacteria bacterium]|nr:hypothetical protein [Candidatus Uhrbacteria bacterium]
MKYNTYQYSKKTFVVIVVWLFSFFGGFVHAQGAVTACSGDYVTLPPGKKDDFECYAKVFPSFEEMLGSYRTIQGGCNAFCAQLTGEGGNEAGAGTCCCSKKIDKQKYDQVWLTQLKGSRTSLGGTYAGNGDINADKADCSQRGGDYIDVPTIGSSSQMQSCPDVCKVIAKQNDSYSTGDLICQARGGTKALAIYKPDSNSYVERFCCDKPLTPTTGATSPRSEDPFLHLQIPIPGLKLVTKESNDTDIRLCEKDTNGVMQCNGLSYYIAAVYKFTVGLAAIISMLVFVYGGLLWLTARGDTGKVQEARKVMTNTIAGLILALGSYTFLWAINPKLLAPKLELNKIEELNLKFTKGEPPGTTDYCKEVLNPGQAPATPQTIQRPIP